MGRIPRKPRELNPEMREGIARKHARYMQMFGEDDWKTIDRKIQDYGNDYYRSDLFVDKPTMVQAIDDFETYRTGTPAMNAVAADMRQFYGLNEPRVMTNLPDDLQAMVDNISAPFQEKAAVVIPVATQATKEAVDQAVNIAKGGKGGLRKAMEAVALADNAVQKAIRERFLDLNDDVAPEKENLRTLLAQTVFRPNRMAPDSYYKSSSPGVAEDVATLLAARALQAGAVAGTAGAVKAGVDGLYALLGETEKEQDVSPALMIRY